MKSSNSSFVILCNLLFCISLIKASSFAYRNYLSTKSPYRTVANLNDSELIFEGCEAEKIFGLIRHGTRTPKTRVIDEMKLRLPEIINYMHVHSNYMHMDTCPLDKDVWGLYNWEFNKENEGNTILTQEGQEEMLLLGHRLGNRFESLINRKYSNSTFYIKYTASQRTEWSAKYFSKGLFGIDVDSDEIWYPEAIKHDPTLRFYKNCDKWKREIKKNPCTLTRVKKYLKEKDFVKTVEDVSKKLGFNSSLSTDDILLMYTTCAFETAWYSQKISPWCLLFSLDNFKAIEFYEDLNYYLFDGYGHELNYLQACPLIKDIYSFFKSNDTYKGKFYFTHSGTLLKTLSHLKLYLDDFSLVDEGLEGIVERERLWRTSLIDTFGTNLVLALYNCSGEKKLLTLHQERIIRFPWCSQSDLCPLSVFEKYNNQSIYNCDFDKICSNHDQK